MCRGGAVTSCLLWLIGAVLLLCSGTAHAQSRTWTYTAGGNVNWTDTGKWAGGIVATGVNNTAQFSGLNITANTTVTVDAGRTISDILTGDTSQSQTWTFNGGPLNLANTTIQPQIRVLQSTVTFDTVITGVNGLRKEQAGTLVLNAANTYTGDTSINRGTLRYSKRAAFWVVTLLTSPGLPAAQVQIKLLRLTDPSGPALPKLHTSLSQWSYR